MTPTISKVSIEIQENNAEKKYVSIVKAPWIERGVPGIDTMPKINHTRKKQLRIIFKICTTPHSFSTSSLELENRTKDYELSIFLIIYLKLIEMS